MSTRSPSQPVAHLRAKKAGLSRSCAPDDPRILEVGRDLAAATIEEYVSRVVAKAPPLTGPQRDRIAALLTAGGGRIA